MTIAIVDNRGASAVLGRHADGRFASRLLKGAATFWFISAVAGQLIFAVYILAFYGQTAVRGDFAAWNQVLPKGHVAGDTMGNAVLAVHILLAAIITVGGPLQLIPRIRSAFPTFHRWNGRVYFMTAMIASVTGLYAVWTRSQAGSEWQHIAISINAVLIIVAGVFAMRHALARQFAAHRRWALRLFLLVSGVWFFRVGLMFWIAVNGGPAGFDPKTFQGPALVAIGFLQSLLPLAVLQLYFAASESRRSAVRIVTAAILLVLTLCMGVGIAVATVGMWWPRIA